MDDRRRGQLRDALNMLSNAASVVERVCDKEQDCVDNYPENLQSTERFEKMEDALDSLNDALEKSTMQKATFSLLSSKEKAGRDCPALLLLKQIVRQFQLEAHQNFSVAFYRAAAIRRHKDICVTKLWIRGY